MFENYDLAITHHGPSFWQSPSSLVLPNENYFKAKGGEDHTAAFGVFADVQRLLGLENLDIALEEIPQLPDDIGHEYGKTSDIAAQYFSDPYAPLITYNPRIMRNPINFIATLAHELMHAKLDPVADQLPGPRTRHRPPLHHPRLWLDPTSGRI